MAAPAAAAAKAAAPPSSFSAILRRSKFASYDPAIAQVYTTFDGDASRGNWGLKRPLALRRRGAHITVASMDSAEQQTEWRRAEQPARWLKMFGELGRAPEPDMQSNKPGSWTRQLGAGLGNWVSDSDYAQAPHPGAGVVAGAAPAADAPASGSATAGKAANGAGAEAPKTGRRRHVARTLNTPNVAAMSNREFKRYEARLRALRPEFASFLREAAAEGAGAPTPFLESRETRELHNQFLERHFAKERLAPASRTIEQMPHKTAGLAYTHAPPVQAYFMSKPLPGRILSEVSRDFRSFLERPMTSSDRLYTTSFAGMAGYVERKFSEALPINPASPTETRFRLESALLKAAPSVVGRRQVGIEGVQVLAKVQSFDKADSLRKNPHAPGSRAWSGHDTISFSPAGAAKRNPGKFLYTRPNTQFQVPDSLKAMSKPGDTLEALRRMVKRNREGSL